MVVSQAMAKVTVTKMTSILSTYHETILDSFYLSSPSLNYVYLKDNFVRLLIVMDSYMFQLGKD